MNQNLPQKRLIIITDDANQNDVWVYALTRQAIDVVIARSADEALAIWNRETFDILLIHLYSEIAEAIRLLRLLRPEITNPILLVVDQTGESDLLDAYAAGADDCLVKPIGYRLFVAKINAWAKRAWTVPAEALDILEVDGLRLNPADRHLSNSTGEIIRLSNLEFRVLYLLMSHRGRVLETTTIVDRVWGSSGSGDSVLLKNVVYRLRRKIEKTPGRPVYLHTFSGGGYSFQVK